MNSGNHSPDVNYDSDSGKHRLKKGAWVGDCEVLDFIGEGGMGEVYKVRHKYLNKTLALKLLPFSEGKAKERFKNEAKALASLSHENIVSIYDYFIDANLGLPCLTMEFIQGESLADIVSKNGPLPESRVISIFSQVFDALSYAHERRIVHRDVKPSNLILSIDARGKEKVHILDFGIAKFVSQVANPGDSITKTGEIVGSPIYMSPEQCRGEKVTELSDLYSCGCCIFFCLTGRPPLKGANALVTIAAKLEGETESLVSLKDELQISDKLASLTDQLIKRFPEERIKSAAEAAALIKAAKAAPEGNAYKVERKPQVKNSHLKKIIVLSLTLALVVALGLSLKSTLTRQTKPDSTDKLINVYLDPSSGSYCMEFNKELAKRGDLGSIGYFIGRTSEAIKHPLSGVFSAPVSSTITLTIGPDIVDQLNLIDQFPPDLVTLADLSAEIKEPTLPLGKLSHFSRLQQIALGGKFVNDGCLEYLEKLPNLRGLTISDTDISPENLGASKLMKRLTSLRINSRFPVYRVFQVSGDCPRLTELILDYTEETTLVFLKKLPNLRKLNLEFENLRELPLDELLQCKKLQKLNLTGSEITDREINALAKLKNLEELVSHGSTMSSAQLKTLKKALPKTKIDIEILDLAGIRKKPAVPDDLMGLLPI